jgi:hypothetical protein
VNEPHTASSDRAVDDTVADAIAANDDRSLALCLLSALLDAIEAARAAGTIDDLLQLLADDGGGSDDAAG